MWKPERSSVSFYRETTSPVLSGGLFNYTVGLGCRDFQKCGSHFKIFGAGRVALIKFWTNYSQTLGATVENLVSTATWRPTFVHPCSIVFDLEIHIFITRAATAMVYWHHIFGAFKSYFLCKFCCCCFVRDERFERASMPHYVFHLGLNFPNIINRWLLTVWEIAS
jgi:hypothetical protein